MPGKSKDPKSQIGELDPKNTVQSLAKGFRVLHAFTAEEPELKLAEVARRAGLDNGTAFRLLETLVKLGYLERFPDGRERQSWPGITYFRVRPTWARYSDFRPTSARVIEIDLAGQR